MIDVMAPPADDKFDEWDPANVAPLVVYLASDESAAVTGAVFPVDAGYTAFKTQVDVMGTMQAGYRWPGSSSSM